MNKQFRTLLRCIAMCGNGAWFIVPVCGYHLAYLVHYEDIPRVIRAQLYVDYRCHAKLTYPINQEVGIELVDWEAPQERAYRE